MATKDPRKQLPAHRGQSHTQLARPRPRPVAVAVPPPRRRRRRNAGGSISKTASSAGSKFVTTTIPAVGLGAGIGVAAIEIAKRYNVAPGKVGAVAGLVGGIGTLVAPKDSAWSSAAVAMAGVGIGLAVAERMQHPPQTLAPAPRQAGGYVTREDLNEALRRAMIEHQADTLGAIREEMRNAAVAYAPPHYTAQPHATYHAPPDEPEVGSWLDASPAPDASYEEEARNAGSWQYAAELN